MRVCIPTLFSRCARISLSMCHWIYVRMDAYTPLDTSSNLHPLIDTQLNLSILMDLRSTRDAPSSWPHRSVIAYHHIVNSIVVVQANIKVNIKVLEHWASGTIGSHWEWPAMWEAFAYYDVIISNKTAKFVLPRFVLLRRITTSPICLIKFICVFCSGLLHWNEAIIWSFQNICPTFSAATVRNVGKILFYQYKKAWSGYIFLILYDKHILYCCFWLVWLYLIHRD